VLHVEAVLLGFIVRHKVCALLILVIGTAMLSIRRERMNMMDDCMEAASSRSMARLSSESAFRSTSKSSSWGHLHSSLVEPGSRDLGSHDLCDLDHPCPKVGAGWRSFP